MTNPALVDMNILIYAHDADSPFFEKSYIFLKEHIAKKTSVLVTKTL